jgi:hypothetical protein
MLIYPIFRPQSQKSKKNREYTIPQNYLPARKNLIHQNVIAQTKNILPGKIYTTTPPAKKRVKTN